MVSWLDNGPANLLAKYFGDKLAWKDRDAAGTRTEPDRDAEVERPAPGKEPDNDEGERSSREPSPSER